MLSHYFHVFFCPSIWIDLLHPILDSELFGARKLILSYAYVAPSGHGIRQDRKTRKNITRFTGAWGRPWSTGLVSPPVWRPSWPWCHHGLPVPIPGAEQKRTARNGHVFPYLRLSHSAVALITPMCACTCKLTLNCLNSLTRCLETMEHDFSYLVLDQK